MRGREVFLNCQGGERYYFGGGRSGGGSGRTPMMPTVETTTTPTTIMIIIMIIVVVVVIIKAAQSFVFCRVKGTGRRFGRSRENICLWNEVQVGNGISIYIYINYKPI